MTKNGVVNLVIISIETFEKFKRPMQRQRVYYELALAEKDVQAGRTMDAYESLDELSKKYGL